MASTNTVTESLDHSQYVPFYRSDVSAQVFTDEDIRSLFIPPELDTPFEQLTNLPEGFPCRDEYIRLLDEVQVSRSILTEARFQAYMGALNIVVEYLHFLNTIPEPLRNERFIARVTDQFLKDKMTISLWEFEGENPSQLPHFQVHQSSPRGVTRFSAVSDGGNINRDQSPLQQAIEMRVIAANMIMFGQGRYLEGRNEPLPRFGIGEFETDSLDSYFIAGDWDVRNNTLFIGGGERHTVSDTDESGVTHVQISRVCTLPGPSFRGNGYYGTLAQGRDAVYSDEKTSFWLKARTVYEERLLEYLRRGLHHPDDRSVLYALEGFVPIGWSETGTVPNLVMVKGPTHPDLRRYGCTELFDWARYAEVFAPIHKMVQEIGMERERRKSTPDYFSKYRSSGLLN